MSLQKNAIKIVTAFACFGSLSSQSYAGTCRGSLHSEHNIGSFDFQTESAISDTDGGRFAYYACVKNLMNEYLRTFWYVPGTMRWTPPNEDNEDVRYFEDKQDKIFLGCLEYGNVGDTTKAQFQGILDDEQKIVNEQQNGCENARPYSTKYLGNSNKEGKEAEELKREINIFVPSDETNPSKTMMTMRGILGLFRTGDNEFSTVLEYYFQPYGDARDGDPTKLKLFPQRIPGDTSVALAFLKTADGIALTEKGTISVPYSVNSNPIIDNVTYNIVDQKGALLASFSAPIYREQQN